MLNKNNLYRLSALMYPDSNSTLNRKNIIKKIIESFFVLNGNKIVTLEELPMLIKEDFNFALTGGEISDIVCESKDFYVIKNGKFNESDNCDDLNIELDNKRYSLLNERASSNSIYPFINKFYEETNTNNLLLEEVQDIIESFLYKVFIQNIEKSKQLFSQELDISTFVESHSFTDKEKKLINQFLDYDAPLKNKAIFDIGCLAIEYVTINGDVDLASQLNNITSKVLYLDTNIMFRLLGINGDLRSKRMHYFLKSCRRNGQELRISKAAEQEFHNALNYSLSQLQPLSSKKMYIEPLNDEDDIISHYFNKKNTDKAVSIDLYKHEISINYDNYINDLGITVEDEDFYTFADGKQRIEIDDLKREIKDFKRFSSHGQAKVDATNVYHIRQLRGAQQYNFNDTKYFLVTADRKLDKWSKRYSTGLPITVFPSDWLSIMLKYITRTEDDYKSFVSFIKTVIHEDQIDKDTIIAILDGISDITDNLESQKYIYNRFVSEHINDIKDLGDYEDAYIKSKDFAEFTMQHQMDEMKNLISKQGIEIAGLNRSSVEERENNKKEKERSFEIIKASIKKRIYDRDDMVIGLGFIRIVYYNNVIFLSK